MSYQPQTPKKPRKIKLVKLTDGEIVRVDLVDSGDNPEANVMFIKARWTTAYVNTLPDSSFAHIAPGGTKDDEGKTVPRSLRHLPYKDADGKPDAAHVRNALARLSQVKGITAAQMNAARRKLVAAAKPMGIEVTEKAMPTTLAAAIEGREQQDKLDRLSWTFRDVVYNIVGSADLSPAEKVAALQANLDQFKNMLSEIVGELEMVVEEGDTEAGPEEMAKRAITAVECAITEARKIMSAPQDKDKGGAPGAVALDINAIPESQRSAVEALGKRAQDAEAAVATEKARADKAEADLAAAQAEVTKLRPADPNAGLDSETRKRIETLEAEVAKARDEREEAESVTKARAYTTSDAEARKCGPILLRVAKGRATADDVAEIERLLKARVEAMKLSGMFKSAGYDGADNTPQDDDTSSELRKRANALVAKGDFKSYNAATDHILSTDKEFADRHNAALRARA